MLDESAMVLFIIPLLVMLACGLMGATMVAVLRPIMHGQLVTAASWRFPLMDLAALVVLAQVVLSLVRMTSGPEFQVVYGAMALLPTIMVWLAGEIILYHAQWTSWQARFSLLVFGLPAVIALGVFNALSAMFFVCGFLGLFVGSLRTESLGFVLLGALLLLSGAMTTWLGRAASFRIADQHRRRQAARSVMVD
jgi:hypothetical protein